MLFSYHFKFAKNKCFKNPKALFVHMINYPQLLCVCLDDLSPRFIQHRDNFMFCLEEGQPYARFKKILNR